MPLEEIKKALETLEDLQRLLTCYRHISSELTEANGIAIRALEKVEKYRWHDLRKNPADLPTVNGSYRVIYADDTYRDMLECYTADFNIEFQHFGHYEQLEHNELAGSPVESWFEWEDEDIVTAWKEIDIFEEVEE